MKKQRFERFLTSLKTMREQATDIQALDSIGVYPEWRDDRRYMVGDRISHKGYLYRCLQLHDAQPTWSPDITPALWVRVYIEEFPEWVQPTGSTDAYMKGDKVAYQNVHYISVVDYNTWRPTEYGWEVYE